MVSVAARMVREKLTERGWNHADFARELRKRGVTVAEGLVSRWLSGQRSPDRARSAAIEELLGVPPKLWSSTRKKRAA
jgi:transcriptional regulator with XRE-family HTH domain